MFHQDGKQTCLTEALPAASAAGLRVGAATILSRYCSTLSGCPGSMNDRTDLREAKSSTLSDPLNGTRWGGL